MNVSRFRRLLLGLLCAAPMIVVSGHRSLAAESRPANVPSDFIVTPSGYFHPSCILTLGRRDVLLANGRLQRASGAVEDPVNCAFAHYTRDGQAVAPGGGGISAKNDHHHGSGNQSTNGGGEYADLISSSESLPYGGLHAFFVVPDHAKSDDGQTLFYWQGLEDAGAGLSVLQPVLGYYSGQWTIAAWNCCLSGVTEHAPLVNVATGDLIYGAVTNNCASGSITCATWNVLIVDLTTGQSSLLADTTVDGQTMSWAIGALLEPYLSANPTCAEYPRDRQLTLYDVTLFDMNLNPIHSPDWQTNIGGTGCDFKVKVDNHAKEIRLSY